MLSLYQELRALLKELEEKGIDYALCGGLAVAVHAEPRATVDIDLLAPEEAWERIREAARGRGFVIEAMPMNFGKGSVKIRRVTKLDAESGVHLILDAIFVTPELEEVWQGRQRAQWEDGAGFSVVSREGLIKMKRLRASPQDLADIGKLEGRLES